MIFFFCFSRKKVFEKVRVKKSCTYGEKNHVRNLKIMYIWVFSVTISGYGRRKSNKQSIIKKQ